MAMFLVKWRRPGGEFEADGFHHLRQAEEAGRLSAAAGDTLTKPSGTSGSMYGIQESNGMASMRNLVTVQTTPVNPTPSVPPRHVDMVPLAGTTTQQTDVPAFTTWQALTTFSGASFAISLISGVLSSMLGWNQKALGVVIAFVLGLTFYWVGLHDGMTTKEKVQQLFVAAVNSFMLAAAALGLPQYLGIAPTGTGTAAPVFP